MNHRRHDNPQWLHQSSAAAAAAEGAVDDTGSLSSSVCTPEWMIPEDMTEERAMEIWLRRNREIDERVQRERALLREQEEAARPEEVIVEHQMQRHEIDAGDHGRESAAAARRPSSNSLHSRSSAGRPEFPSGRRDDDDDDDDDDNNSIGSGYINADGHSDAWERAISRNAMGPYDPARHDAWWAYQRFININQPGVAENFVPSTPGLARLLEEQRQAEREAAERERREAADAQHRALLEEQERRRREGSASASQYQESPQRYADPLAAQAREYERLSQAHRTHQQAQAAADTAAYVGHPQAAAAGRGDVSVRSSSTNSSDKPDNKKTDDKSTKAFYLATPIVTDYNTRPVTCWHCYRSLYTHPLARNYMCQNCCLISSMMREAEEVQGEGNKRDEWDEKMMDREDYPGYADDVDMAY